jgi:formylglycine-generating enzyme required for sulfatase activity
MLKKLETQKVAVNKMKTGFIDIFMLLSCFIFLNSTEAQPIRIKSNNMVLIKGGQYEPLYIDSSATKIKVASFYMDKYPVTNEQFIKFVEENPRWKKSKIKKLFADDSYLLKWRTDTEPGEKVNLTAPVTNVSWFAAKEYCECEGKRLPTIAEWEYAARASTNKLDATKDQNYLNKIIEWYSKPTPAEFKSVGQNQKNYWGVYDMHGLVWEWTSDFFTTLVTGESRGDSSIEKNLFCGSGSFSASNFKNYPAFMRFAFRSSLKANYTINNLGFRCVSSLSNEVTK